MAHKNWCGEPCEDCKKPCFLDQSMPCSPDCSALNPDGSRDEVQCVGCDAIVEDNTQRNRALYDTARRSSAHNKRM